MSGNKNNSARDDIPLQVLLSFEENDKNQVTKVWSASSYAEQDFETPSAAEIEDTLTDLHIRLDFNDRSDRIAGWIQSYGRYAAAAVALIVIGTAFLFLPQTAEAPYGEMVEITLPDGSEIELNSGSTVQFNRLFGFTNRSITLNGEGYFSVKNNEEPFRVLANGTITEVLGTKFNVRSWSDHPENETIVTVAEGHVRFYTDGEELNGVTLQQQMESRWQRGLNLPEDPATADLERMTDWRDQKFIFYEESLQQIFRELERRFNLQIDLQNSRAAAETLTGYYGTIQNPESLLDDICTVAGLNYSKTANGYRVY